MKQMCECGKFLTACVYLHGIALETFHLSHCNVCLLNLSLDLTDCLKQLTYCIDWWCRVQIICLWDFLLFSLYSTVPLHNSPVYFFRLRWVYYTMLVNFVYCIKYEIVNKWYEWACIHGFGFVSLVLLLTTNNHRANVAIKMC